MIHMETGVYLCVQQLADRAHPLPLENGFSENTAYRGLGIYSPSETSECYLILANDRDETWFISNRHLRIVGVFPDRRDLRFELQPDAVHGCANIRRAAHESSLEAQAA
ncbi:MAG: hypothetical protein ABI624_04125 [Casimicrobiaceae bacterium]